MAQKNKKVEKWEYRFVIVSGLTSVRSDLIDKLNDVGEEGWEAFDVKSSDQDRVLCAWLKRKKQ